MGLRAVGAIALVGLSMSCGGGRGGNTDADGNSIGVGLKVKIISGSNQFAKKSTAFALPLVARVESPAGDPVPEMMVECRQTSSTDGYITGPVKFKTDSSGLISTTAFSPSTYDEQLIILCELPGTPNGARFVLESAFTVDHVEWVIAPASPYTADSTNPMVTFQARIMDDTNTVIDVSNTKHWLDLTVTTAGNPSPLGTTRQYFTNGVATFSDIKHLKANSITLRAAYNKNPAKYIEQTITVDPNVTTKSIVVLPGQIYTSGVMTVAEAVTGTPTNYTADDSFVATVLATDDYFNTTTDTSAIAVSNPTDLSDTDPLASNFVAGVQTFTISPVQAKTGHLIRPVSTLADNDSSTFTVTAGAPTHLITRLPGQTFSPGQTSLAAAITGVPTTQTAGTSFAPIVYATDAEFNQVSSTAITTLATSDPADTEPAPAAMAAGARTFTVTNITSGVQTVTASAAGFASNVSTGFTVNNAPATQMVITTQPAATIAAGSEIAPVIEIRDTYGNIVTVGPDATANVTMSLFSGTGALAGTLTKAAVAGVADFTGLGAYANLIGAKVIRLTKASTAGSGGVGALVVNTNSFTVVHGPAAVLVWTTQPSNPTTVSANMLPVIAIRDAYTNAVTTGTDATTSITLSIQSGTGTLNGTTSKAAVGGIVTWTAAENLHFLASGSKVLLATKPDNTGTGGSGVVTQASNTFTVSHGPAAQLAFTTQPADPTAAGAEIASVVEIQDSYGNVVDSGPDSTANVSMNLQAGTGTLGGTVSVTAVLGVANFTGAGMNITLVGTNKVIRATKSSTVGSGGTVSLLQNSDPFDIVPGIATQLVYTTQPANNTVAGADLLPVIQIRDAYNNLSTVGPDATANVTMSLQTGTGAIAGTVTVAASGGIATWTGADNLYVNLVGAKTIRATKADLSGSGGAGTLTRDSNSFTIVHAAASSLVYTTQPATGVAGTNLVPVLEIRDAFGNVTTSDSTSVVTLTLQNNPGTSTFAGTKTRTVVAGVATWTAAQAMFLNKSGVGYVIRASDGTRTVDSDPFDVTAAAASALAFTTQPATGTAGTNLLPVVEIRDAYGNVRVGDSTSTITLTIQTNPGSSTLAGTAALTVVNGIATWTAAEAMYLNKVGTGYVLRASDGTRTVNSAAFNVTVGAASALAFTTQPASGVAGTNLLPVVQIQDAYGNVRTPDSASVITLTIQTNPGSGTLAGTTTRTVSSGTATWLAAQAMYIDKVGTGYVLRASDGTLTVDSDPFNVTVAAASVLAYTTQPATGIAGTNLVPVVEIRDAYGNVRTNDNTSTITLTIQTNPGSSTLAGTTTRTVVAGVATWTATEAMYLNKVGTGYVLRASDGTRTVNSAAFNVTHAPASVLAYTTQPATGVAGANLVPVVEIRDAYANVITSDNTSVITLTIQTNPGSSTLAGTTTRTVVAGVATWTAGQAMYLNKVGTGYVLQASDGTLTVNSSAFNVTHAPASVLAYTTHPASGVAGTNLLPVVEIRDAYGNVTTSDSTSVITLSIQTNPGAGTLAGTKTRTVVNGVATWLAAQAMYLDKVGTGYVLQASDGTRTVNSNAFNVTHAAASALAYTTHPATGVAGTNLLPVVEIRDTYGNVVTSDSTSTITLTIQTNPGSSTLAGTAALTVASGIATWTAGEAMYLNKVGVGYKLRASDGTRTVDSNAFNVTLGAPDHLTFTTHPASGTVGTNLVPVVEIRDFYENVITTDNASVITLSIQTNPGGATLAGTNTRTVVAGVATWTGAQAMFLDKTGTGYVLRASDGTRTVDSNAFNQAAGVATQLVYTTQPASSLAGANLLPVIEIRDSLGNVITTGPDASANITINLQTGTGTLSGTLTVPASNGIAAFTATEAVYVNLVGAKTLRATKASTVGSGGVGILTQDSNSFTISHAAASVLAYTTQPASGVAGTNLVPVIEIRDAYTNVTTSDNASVITLTIQTNPGSSTLAGTTTRTVVAGVATWTAGQAMFLDKVGTGYVLQTSDGTRTLNSNAFNVTHGAASVLAYTTQPATGTTGTNLVPVVEIRDAYANVVTSDNASVITLTIQTNPGTSTLAGTTTRTVVAGVATWTAAQAMYLNKVGTGYVLRASDGTRTVDSNAFNVTVGAATNLAFATQPATGVAGTNLVPVVEIHDAYGNVRTGDNTSVITLTIQTNPGTSTLAGTTTRTVVAGVATWTAGQAMFLNKVGTGYVLQASDGTLTQNSAAFNVTVGAASALAFSTQPVDSLTGDDLLPVVQIVDAYGNVRTGDNASSITLNLQVNPSGATLAGTKTLTVSAGVATWTSTQGMFINLVGTGYVLRATDGTRTIDSNAFNIIVSEATQLVFTTQPANSVAGANLLPVIEIRDALGNVITTGPDSNPNVTISLQSGTGTLSGTLTVPAVAGVASFTATQAVYINLVGSKTLRASKADTTGSGGVGVLTVDSNAFTISHAAASVLAYTTHPATGTAGTNLLPVAEIRDTYGNVTTSDNASVITLTIQTNPGTSTLAGTTTRTVVAGVATWTAAQAMFLNKVGTGYVLQASDGTRTVNSNAFNVTVAAASALAYTTHPATGSAGTNLVPVVEIRDAYGNVRTGDNTSVITLTIQTNPGTSTLAGTTTRTVVNGVATWAAAQAMYLNKVGTGYVLEASDGTLTVNSNAFNVTHAAASVLAYTTQPSSGVAGTNLVPVVEIRDTYGNVTTSDNASVIALTIQTNPGTSTLAGTTTRTVVAGVATWAAAQAMYLNKVGTGYVLRASDGTRTVDSTAFNVTPAAAGSLAFTTHPATGSAGTNLVPVVEIRDAYGNVTTGDSASVITLTIQTNPGTSTLAGTTTRTVSSGVATWTATEAMFLDKVGTGYVLQASDGTRTVNSNAFNVTHAAASVLAYTTHPATGVAGTNLLPVVEIRDAYGNVTTSDSTSVITLTIQTNPGSSTLAGTTTRTVVNGVATWLAAQAMYLNKVGTGYVLRASDGTRTVDSNAFNVTPAAASALAFTTHPATGVAGTNLLPVVEIRDAYGNVRTGDSASTITLTIQTNPGTSTLAGTAALTVTAGVATWTATEAMFLNKVGTGYVLQASDGTRTINSNAFNVTHAAASALAYTTHPATGTAGTNLLPVVEIRDTYGNVVTSDSTSVITLTIQTNPGTSTLAGTTTRTVVNGVATWLAAQAMYLNKVGTGYVLQASDGTLTVNSNAFNVTVAAAASLAFTTHPATGAAGTNLVPVVEIRDTYGNVRTTDSASTITLTIQTNPGTSALAGTAALTVTNGVATWAAAQAMYLNKVGTGYVLQASDGTRTVNSNAFNVTHAAAAALAYTTHPATGTAGTALVPVVEIRDTYGNVVTSDSTSVITLTIQTNPGSSTLGGTATRTVSSGVATWLAAQALTLDKVGTGYVLQASDGTLTVNSNAFNVTHGAASVLAFTTHPATGVAGSNLVPVVEIRDANGNVVTSDSTSVITLTIQTNPGTSTLAGTTTRTVVNGVATWLAAQGMYLNKVGTGYVLEASDGTRTVNSNAFNVTHAAASALAYTTHPATGAAGTNLVPVVEIRDTYGNVVTSDSASTITLTIQTNPGTSTLAGTTALTVSSGVATWTAGQAMFLNKVGTGYVLQASDGTRTVNSNAFNVTHAAASALAYTTHPATGAAGTNLVPVVEIRDTYGNVVTSDSASTITLTIQTNPGTSTLAGTAALIVTSGVAIWTAAELMYLDKVGTGYVLQASDGTRTVNSNAFNVTPAAANALAFTTHPSTGVAGTNLVPVVEIRDAYGNVRTTDSASTITLTIQTNPGTSTLAGTAALTVANGVATWTAGQAMFLNKVGTGYVLQASDGTRTVNSNAFNVTHAAASALAYTTHPATGAAGTNLVPVVEIRDTYGNVITSDSASVITLTIQTNPGSSTLAGTTTRTVASGVATWTAAELMYLDKVGTGYVLQASDGTRTINSNAFNVTVAAAASLAFTTHPATGAAGTNLVPVVEIRDTFGNVRTTDSASTITLTIQTNPGTSTLAGTAALTVTNGVATWTAGQAMYLNKVGTGYVLRASDGTRTVDSNAFNVTHAAVSALAFATQPATGVAGANLVPVVELRDTYGNVVTSDSTSSITLSIQTNPGSSTLAGTKVLTAASGVATWTATEAMYLDKVGTGYVLQATDGTLTVNSAAFNVTPTGAATLAWTTHPSSGAAGTNLVPVIELRDTYGNVLTGDSATQVTLSIQTNPSAGTLFGTKTLTFASGVATWTATEAMYLDKVGTGYVLRATSGVITADSNAFNVSHAPASQLVYTTQPATNTLADDPLTPVLEVRDTYNNLVTTGVDATVNVTLSLQSGTGTLAGSKTRAASGGVVTFIAGDAISIEISGSKVIRATKADLSGSGGTASVFVDSSSFNILGAPASNIIFSTQPVNTVAGGNLLPVITIRTASNITVDSGPDATANITITLLSGTGAISGTVTVAAVAGVASFTATQAMYINLIGAKTIRATKEDTSGFTGGTVAMTADSNSFTITHAAVSQLAYTTQPATGTVVASALTPVVEVRDTYGNLVSTGAASTSTITLSKVSGAGVFTGTMSIAAVAGVATFPSGSAITTTTAGAYVLRASDGTRTVDSDSFNMAPGAVSSIAWTAQPNATRTADQLFTTGEVELLDAYSNRATNASGSVQFEILDYNDGVTIKPNPTGAVLAGTTLVTVSSGLASLTSAAIRTVGANYYLKASFGAVTTAPTNSSTAITISVGAPSKLIFTSIPGTWPINLCVGSTVIKIADAYNNPTNANGSVTSISVAIGTNPAAGTLSGTVSLAPTAGVSTFTCATQNLRINNAGAGYTLSATSAGVVFTGTSAAFAVTSTPALKTEVAYEMLDQPKTNKNAAGGTTLITTARTSLDTNDFPGTANYYFEVVGYSNSGNPASNRDILLVDAAGTTIATATFTQGTVINRVRSAAFTPTAGASTYRIQVRNDNVVEVLRLYSARIIVEQPSAYGTRVYVPLLSENIVNRSDSATETAIDTTASTTYTQGAPLKYAIWQKDTSLMSTIPSDGYTLEVMMASTAGQPVQAALYNKTTGLMVTGSETPTTTSAVATLLSVSFDNSAVNFTNLDSFEVRIKSSAGGSAKIFKAALYIKIVAMTKYATFWRSNQNQTFTAATPAIDSRWLYTAANYSSPIIEYECTGTMSSAGTMKPDLSRFGTVDSAGTATQIASSQLTFSASSPALLRSPALTMTTANRYMTNVTGTTGTLDLTQCLTIIRN